MAYRSGELRLDDQEAGPLRVTGDGYAAAGEPVTLVLSPDVQRFLGMSDDEIARAAAIDRRYREALRRTYTDRAWRPTHLDPAALPARREAAHEIGGLLGEERAARLHRLSWRVRGGDALLDEDVAGLLRLTDEQRRQLGAVAEENEREYARVLAEYSAVRGRGAQRTDDPAGLGGRVADADAAGSARLLALLTPEQQDQFTRLRAARG